MIELAVNGTLMRGLELSHNMQKAGAKFLREDSTAPCYELWTIDDIHPAMQRMSTGGASIALEVWNVPPEGLAAILASEPPGLCIGKVQLKDGTQVLGVLGEAILCQGKKYITETGGWRNYRNAPFIE